MHTKASSDPGCADQLIHKFLFLTFQFRKLIGNNKEMRKRYAYLASSVQFLISINVHSSFVSNALGFIKNSLTSFQFTLYRHQRTPDRRTIQICDRSYKMGKVDSTCSIIKSSCQTSSFVINKHKGNFIRMKIHCQ